MRIVPPAGKLMLVGFALGSSPVAEHEQSAMDAKAKRSEISLDSVVTAGFISSLPCARAGIP
jgi:hypothetical protein